MLISILARSCLQAEFRGAGHDEPMEKVSVEPDTDGWEATRHWLFQAVKQPQYGKVVTPPLSPPAFTREPLRGEERNIVRY